MANKNTSSTETREAVTKNIVDHAGASYFNPLIGMSAGETCAKIEPVMEMLHELFHRNLISEDVHCGVKSIINTVWAAVQFEAQVADAEGSGNAPSPNPA